MSRQQLMSTLVARLVALLVEVDAGLRPMRHLRPFMAPALQGQPVLSPSPTVRRVGRILVQQRSGVCEAVVMLHERNGRASAVALALVRDHHGWVVSAICRPGQVVACPPGNTRPALPMAAWELPGRSTTHLDTVPGEGPSWRIPDGWAAGPPPAQVA